MPHETLRLPKAPAGFRFRSDSAEPDVGPPEPVPAAPPRVSPEEVAERQQREIAGLLAALRETMDEFEQRRQQSLGELQQVAVELALLAAEHVIGKTLNDERFSIERLIMAAIDRIGILERARIRLNPNDLTRLQSQAGTNSMVWLDNRITLTADPAITPGGLRLDTESGRVLLSDVTTRLNQIREEWRESLHDAEAECRRTASGTATVRRFPDRRETA